MKYEIQSFDADGYEIGHTTRDTLKEATQVARYMLTPAYKNAIETDRDAARVEVLRGGACVWDYDVPAKKAV